MKKFIHFLNSPIIVTPNFRQIGNYAIAYLIGGPSYVILILLNCRFIFGQFIFNWDSLSWYVTVSYVFLFPIENILSAQLATNRYVNRHHLTPTNPRHLTPKPPEKSQRLHHLRAPVFADIPIGESVTIQTLLAVLGILFAPLILLILLIGFVLTTPKL